MRRPALLFVLAVLLRTSAWAQCDPPPQIIRINGRDRHIFVEARQGSINTVPKARRTLRPIEQYVRECKSGWGNDWQAAFTNDRQYAAYKTEVAENPVFEPQFSHHWRAYWRAQTGLYDRNQERLWLGGWARGGPWLRVPLSQARSHTRH